MYNGAKGETLTVVCGNNLLNIPGSVYMEVSPYLLYGYT